MATVKSLEDMLSSEVDESAVTALVGSLESQLASSDIQLPSQDVNTTSVTVNHVNNAVLVDGNVTRLLDGQKQGVIAVSQPVSLLNVGKSSVVGTQITDSNVTSTTSNTNNVIATLPGALPASGYITQVTGPSQQTFFSPVVSGNITVNRSSNNQEIKVVYTSQSVVSQINSTSTINTRSKTAAAAAAALPNGSPNNLSLMSVRSNQTSSMSAIYDLATVASQQSPIVTSNSCNTTTTATSSQVQVTIANGKQVTATKSQPDTKLTDKSGKPSVSSRSQDTVTVPSSIVQTTVMHQVGTNVIQVNTPSVMSKSHATTSQPVSVVSQVVSNPSLLNPGVQIVNVNPRLGVPGIATQKTLAPRVMLATTNPVRIAPQILTARTGVAGQVCYLL